MTSDERQHYVLIKYFNRFMYNQALYRERKQFCMHCLQCISSKVHLTNHKEVCVRINGKQGSLVKYENFHKQLDAPFVIYGDFEAELQKSCGYAGTTREEGLLVRY